MLFGPKLNPSYTWRRETARLTSATVCQYPGTIVFASSAGSPTSGIGNNKCSCSTGRTRLSWLRVIRLNSVTKTNVAKINTIRAETFSKTCSCNRTQFYVSHRLKNINRKSESFDVTASHVFHHVRVDYCLIIL